MAALPGSFESGVEPEGPSKVCLTPVGFFVL